MLKNLTKDVVMVNGNSPGNFATFTCDPDYELVGMSVLVCGNNSQWNAEPPICRRKKRFNDPICVKIRL